MKRINAILFLLIVYNLTALKAELFQTLSIVELSYKSDKVVEAHFLKKEHNDYIFLVRDVNKETKTDTLSISYIDKLFEDGVGFTSCDKLLIYLQYNSENELFPTWSGYRLLVDSTIFFPFQYSNPGKFSFAKSRDDLNWEELLNIVQNVHSRIQDVKQIRQIKSTTLRNKKLFDWIEHNRNSFGKSCGLNDDCGWGPIELDVFKWITEGNISSDTWKASKLFREVNSESEDEWRRSYRILGDANGNSFNTYEDIDFLIKVSLNKSNSLFERKQALSYLIEASKKVYEDNYPIPDSLTLNFQIGKQKLIRNLILPLLNNENLKEDAFRVIKKMSNPEDGNLNHRIDLDVLPLIKGIYQKEPPGRYKSDLAEFIVRNSTTEEWKKFSNCDANIFVDLYHVGIDTSSDELHFGINYNYGREIIKNKPIIHIWSIHSNSEIFSGQYSDFKIPYEGSQGVRYLTTDIGKYKKGKYRVYVTGSAGEKSQYDWESEHGEFEIK